MDELKYFLSTLIDDTLNNTIFWNIVGDWGGEYLSIDFSNINSPLFKWADKEPFIFNRWADMYVTNIMSGFVYITKTDALPPRYFLYIQPDADSRISLVNCESSEVKKLHDIVTSQMTIAQDHISEFVYEYLRRHFKKDTD